MLEISLVIATEFSDAPGARYESDGPASGELFFKKLLRPKFQQALKESKTLLIDLDGTFGYATSFISESFGTLSKEFGADLVLKTIRLKSEEDPQVAKFTYQTIQFPEKNQI